MTYTLNARQSAALDEIEFDHNHFYIKGELVGIGDVTLSSLVDLGLIEVGIGRHGEQGWRITADGMRCKYGETIDEILAKPDGVKIWPFRIYRWPVDPAASRRLR